MSSMMVAQGITNRQAKAAELVANGAVHPIRAQGVTFAAWVQSQSDPTQRYYVTLGPESCTCPDYEHGHNAHLCKHILAARYHYIWLMEG